MAYVAVAPEGRTHREQVFLREAALPGLRRLTDAVHAEGAAVAAQIGHAGPVANGRSNGVHAIAPSAMPSPLSMQMVRAATRGRPRPGPARLRLRRRGSRSGPASTRSSCTSATATCSARSSARTPTAARTAYGGSLENRARVPAPGAAGGPRRGRRRGRGLRQARHDRRRPRRAPGRGVASTSPRCSRRTASSTRSSSPPGSSLMNPMYLFRGPCPLREFAAQMPLPVRLGMRHRRASGFLKEYPYEEAFLLPDARLFRERLDLPLMLLGGISTRATHGPRDGRGLRPRRDGRAAAPRARPASTGSAAARPTGATCIHCNRCMPSIYTGTRCVLDHPEPLSSTPDSRLNGAPHDPGPLPPRRAGRRRHRRRPRHRRRYGARAGRGRRRRAHLLPHRGPAHGGRRADQGARPPGGRGARRPLRPRRGRRRSPTRAVDELGRLDVVVNNVGGTIPNAFLDTTPDYLEEAFRFNVSTAHALSRAAVP